MACLSLAQISLQLIAYQGDRQSSFNSEAPY